MDKTRRALFKIYKDGDILKCSNPKCPNDDPEYLQFNHINGDGSKEREKYLNKKERSESGNRSISYTIYRDMLSNQPTGINILCANCNTKFEYVRKRYESALRRGSLSLGKFREEYELYIREPKRKVYEVPVFDKTIISYSDSQQTMFNF
jgi:hypothetical protein